MRFLPLLLALSACSCNLSLDVTTWNNTPDKCAQQTGDRPLAVCRVGSGVLVSVVKKM